MITKLQATFHCCFFKNKMLVLDNAILCGGNGISHLFLLEKRSTRTCSIVGFAKKNNNFSENSKAQQLKISRTLVAQSAIGVFALGFVDSGFKIEASATSVGIQSRRSSWKVEL
ncbi:OLC1v1035269C2 [Oldenlandia corymbosa var. corymbosa]|uniref:OLC1v1035269C2 n=1 Tax=Oldenlandia corymbosa var. corymbosa TaxID=529605 RepID=A0AAV1CVV7_OLDCO|nr:OLC1v1035269C2 [Oldenlandia corymbosa var. corymbosa]